jgi:hypothetical protein
MFLMERQREGNWFDYGQKDAGQQSPRRWGWGIPLKKRPYAQRFDITRA